jgi:uncharacterized protein
MKRQIRTLLASGLLALALFGTAMAGPLEDAHTAYGKGDYKTAFQIFRPLAEQGNAEAQIGVGLMYRDGEGVPQDYAQAVVWFLKVANQGNEPYGDLAKSCLGDMYRDGLGVPQDYFRAHMWYNLASTHGGYRYLRDQLAAKMTPAQIAEAQRMAGEWVPKK